MNVMISFEFYHSVNPVCLGSYFIQFDMHADIQLVFYFVLPLVINQGLSFSKQEKFSSNLDMGEKANFEMLSFEAPKIRLLRSLYIEGSDGMQVECYNFLIYMLIVCMHTYMQSVNVLTYNKLDIIIDTTIYKLLKLESWLYAC